MLRVIRDIEIEVDKSEICQRLDYEKGQSPSPRTSSLIDSQLEESHVLIEPQVCYAIKPIRDVNGATLSVGGLVFTSHRISPMFSGCTQAAIFVATIGKGLEKKAARLMERGLALEALVVDSLGSAAVEKVADRFESEVRGIAAAEGNKAGRRYSPGYCDWDIIQQKELFRLLDGESIGVNLTGACLMTPRKSISGMIGIGESCITSSACHFCNKKDCPTRKEEFVP